MTTRPVTTAQHAEMMSCRQFVLSALTDEMRHRHVTDVWIDNERHAVAVAANDWAQAHGIDKRLTVADVERIERRAVGHSDYATKLALYVAEAVVYRDVAP